MIVVYLMMFFYSMFITLSQLAHSVYFALLHPQHVKVIVAILELSKTAKLVLNAQIGRYYDVIDHEPYLHILIFLHY